MKTANLYARIQEYYRQKSRERVLRRSADEARSRTVRRFLLTANPGRAPRERNNL